MLPLKTLWLKKMSHEYNYTTRRSQPPGAKMLCTLEGRTWRLHEHNPDDAALEAVDLQQREQLLVEDNFHRAMSVFTTAYMTHVPQGSYQRLHNPWLPVSHLLYTICFFAHVCATLLSMLPFIYTHSSKPMSIHRLTGKHTMLVFYYLLSTYINTSDLDEDKEVFAEFNNLCARDLPPMYLIHPTLSS